MVAVGPPVEVRDGDGEWGFDALACRCMNDLVVMVDVRRGEAHAPNIGTNIGRSRPASRVPC